MNKPTIEERQQMLEAMSEVYEYKEKCRCKAIEKKVNLGGIKKLSEIRNISIFKARKIYDETIEPFHTCCHLCCTCHLERHSESILWDV